MKRRVLSLLLAGVMAASALPGIASAAGLSNFQKSNTYTPGQFADVPAGSWYAAGVQSAYELGLMTGTSGTAFDPSGNLTLAETVVLAARLHSIYTGDGASFTGGATWYQPYVDYAIQNGIIASGAYSDYSATATRAQFASILAAALPSEALPAINTVTALPDVDANATYAAAALKLYNAGILTGSDASGTFNPTSYIQRSEVATIVTRMADQSQRKTFTLSTAQAQGPAQQGRSPMRTQADLEGTWSAVYTDGSLYEYTFSGDHFTRVVSHEFSDHTTYSVQDGTYTMTSEPIDGDENVRRLTLDVTYDDITCSTDSGVTNNGSKTFTYTFTTNLTVPEDCFIWAGATFYRAEPTAITEYQTVLANFGGLQDPSDAGYPMYAAFPDIPDFGAIYDLELMPEEDIDWTGEMGLLQDLVESYTEDMTTYSYRAKDVQEQTGSFVPPALDVDFFQEYEEALEACGFKGEFRRNLSGDLQFYYVGYGYLVSYDIIHLDLSYITGSNNYGDDEIVIYIQPD